MSMRGKMVESLLYIALLALLAFEAIVCTGFYLFNISRSQTVLAALIVTAPALIVSIVVYFYCQRHVTVKWFVFSVAGGSFLGWVPFLSLIAFGPSVAVDVTILPGQELIELLGRNSYFSSTHLNAVDQLRSFNEVVWANSLIGALLATIVGAAFQRTRRSGGQ